MFHKLTIVGIFLRILYCVFFLLTIITFASILVGQGLAGDLIAFEVSGSQHIAIYIADLNYGLAVNVTHNSVDNTEPIWISDGHLIFVSGTNSNHDIYSLTLDQLDAINISNTSHSHTPMLSSSGRLAYITEQYPQPNRIDILNSEGNIQSYSVNLSSDLYNIEMPSWLSDHEIVFLGSIHSGQKQVFLLNLSNNNLQQISGDLNLIHSNPTASPRGDMIAFISYDLSTSLRKQNVWVWEKASNSLFLVTENNAINGDFSWSDDGNLAFASNSSGNMEIYVWNSQTNALSNVTKNAAYDANPSWSENGEIGFTSDRQDQDGIYVLNPVTGVTEEIYILRGSRNPVWSK